MTRAAAPWVVTGVHAFLVGPWLPIRKVAHQAMRRYPHGLHRELPVAEPRQHQVFVRRPRHRAVPGGRKEVGLQKQATIPSPP
jgi:hypothetical protein